MTVWLLGFGWGIRNSWHEMLAVTEGRLSHLRRDCPKLIAVIRVVSTLNKEQRAVAYGSYLKMEGGTDR